MASSASIITSGRMPCIDCTTRLLMVSRSPSLRAMCGGCQGLLLGHFAIKFMRIKTPFTPTMTQETNQPPLEVPHSTGHESGKPLPFVPPITAVQQPAQSTPVQTAPAAAQPAPVTQLERVVQTDRNLTPGDRNRLSDALFDYAQFLEQRIDIRLSSQHRARETQPGSLKRRTCQERR